MQFSLWGGGSINGRIHLFFQVRKYDRYIQVKVICTFKYSEYLTYQCISVTSNLLYSIMYPTHTNTPSRLNNDCFKTASMGTWQVLHNA